MKKITHAEYVKARVYRVLITYSNGAVSSGSGFFISKQKFITCFHVIFSTELKNIRNLPEYHLANGANEHEKLASFFKAKEANILIELADGTKLQAQLNNFSEFYDLAVLKVTTVGKKINLCKISKNLYPTYGDLVSFGGFPDQFGYTHDTTPFAYTEGIVSSFPTTSVAGDTYEHIKINAINLSGNSGAPLFLNSTGTVIGVINGNMNWGRDDLLISQQTPTGQPIFQPASFRIPLSIAYATSLKIANAFTKSL